MQQAEQIQKPQIPKSLEKAFQRGIFYENEYPKEKINFVGICKFPIKEQKVYPDEKLFRKNDEKSLLLQFYEYVIKDHEESKKLSDAFHYESKSEFRIKLQKDVFDTLVPFLFENELSKILRYGLLKAYELREENLQFLRGKLNLNAQIRNKIRKKPYIASRYWDLTTDIFLNRLLFKAANIFSSKQLSSALRSKFSSYCNAIGQEMVSMVEITPNDLKLRRYIPQRYKIAINLAEAIIKRYYHSIIEKKEVECPSFMIDASVVWESFLRVAVNDILTPEGWDVHTISVPMKILCRESGENVNVFPDIIAIKGTSVLIMDAKYKSGPRVVSDMYQICAYLGAYKAKDFKNLKGFLLYLSGGNDEEDYIDRYNFYPEGTNGKPPVNIDVLYVYEIIRNSIKENKLDKNLFLSRLKDRLLDYK